MVIENGWIDHWNIKINCHSFCFNNDCPDETNYKVIYWFIWNIWPHFGSYFSTQIDEQVPRLHNLTLGMFCSITAFFLPSRLLVCSLRHPPPTHAHTQTHAHTPRLPHQHPPLGKAELELVLVPQTARNAELCKNHRFNQTFGHKASQSQR